MKKSLIQFVIIISVMGIISVGYAGSVPSLVNYQGKLTDADGNALKGPTTIECSIYDSAAATGSIVWGPQVFTNIALVNGVFNVILGNDSNGKSISSAFSSDARYLSIKVGGVEITPRQQILSTPFALNAGFAYNAASALIANNTPAPRLQNLRVSNNSLNRNDVLDISADYVTVYNNEGYCRVLTIPSGQITANISKSGAGGLDIGVEAKSIWYYIYVIFNPNTNSIQSLLSTSKLKPTLPDGYNFFKRISAVYNDESNNFYYFKQINQNIILVEEKAVLLISTSNPEGYCNKLTIERYIPEIAIRITGFIKRMASTNRFVRISSYCTGVSDYMGSQFLHADTVSGQSSNFILTIIEPSTIYYSTGRDGECTIQLIHYEIDL